MKKQKPKQTKCITLNFRLSREELSVIELAAKLDDRKRADYLRSTVLRAARSRVAGYTPF